jgi:YD repeat-containing protein
MTIMRKARAAILFATCTLGVATASAQVQPRAPNPTPGYLTTPDCGRFGPSQEVHANLGELWTHMGGGSASHILYPYLAGCTVREWRSIGVESPPGYRDIQGFFFDRFGKSQGGYWQRSQLQGEVREIVFNSVNFMQYNERGYLVFHTYRCDQPGTDGWEYMRFDYDDRDRLLRLRFTRPAGCFRPRSYDAPGGIDYRYSYEDPVHTRLPTRIVQERLQPTASTSTLEVTYKGAAGRLEGATWLRDGKPAFEERFTYDASGRIVEADKVDRWGRALHRWQYHYTVDGRLRTADRSGGFRFEFTYGADGRLDTLLSPTPHYVAERDGERRNTLYRAVYPSADGRPDVR